MSRTPPHSRDTLRRSRRQQLAVALRTLFYQEVCFGFPHMVARMRFSMRPSLRRRRLFLRAECARQRALMSPSVTLVSPGGLQFLDEVGRSGEQKQSVRFCKLAKDTL